MASINMASFYNDPVYRRLAIEAQRPEASQGEQSAPQGEQSAPMSGGDSPDPFAGTGGISPSRLSTLSPVSAQTTMREPVYGTTPDEGLLKRGEQGIAANIQPILQSIALGDTAPLKFAAAGAGVQSLLGDRPSYLESTVSGGLQTQTGGFTAGKSYAQLETGRIVEVDPMDTDIGNVRTLTAAQAARLSPMDYVGADPRKPGGTLGQAFQMLAAPPLMGVMFGKVAESPTGTPVALGSVGFLSERIHDAMFDFQEGVNENKPGYFAMQIGNRYSAYNANAGMFDITVAGMNLTRQQFERIYGAGMGKDYRYVDWKNSTAGDLKGPSLIGFTNQGGFTEAGEFMTPSGAVMTGLNSKQMRDYVSSLPNDPITLARVSGVMAANAKTARSKYQRNLMAKNAARLAELAQPGQSRREYDEGLASRSPEEIAYDTYAFESGGDGTGPISTVKGYTTVSGSDDRDDSRSDGNTYNFNQPDPSEVYFAEGGRVNKAVGMMAGEEQPQPEEMGPVGFVNGKTPEEAGEAATVRDDVEGTVPEGTFVISGASVEKYGSERIRKLLISALREAQVQGIDISATDSKIVDEESVSVAVSEGEVLIPPVLVRIIGLQKLEKINALGQDEVDRRVAENGQANPSMPVEGEAPVQASVKGGFAERQKKFSGDLVKPLKIVLGKSGKIDTPEYLDSTFENAFKNMMRNRRAVEESVQQKIRMDEPVPPLEDLQKQLRQIHQQYQDDMKEIKRVSDPYVFQEYMRTHTDASADYLNAIEGFGEKEEKSVLLTDNYLGDLAKMRVSIPIGSQDDSSIPTGTHYGITFRESSAGDRARGYTHGFASKSTTPASTGFHEAGHISLRDKEKANPLYRGIDGAFVYRRKNENGKIIDGAYLTEEEMMRVHDMFRSLSNNNQDAYKRARNFISRNPDSNFGNYLENKTDKEVESVVYDIVYGALTNDYFGEHEVKRSFAKQRLPRPK